MEAGVRSADPDQTIDGFAGEKWAESNTACRTGTVTS
jgi:hypothetical protein